MMFSATLPAAIIKLSQKYLTNPERISVGDANIPAPKVHQEIIHTTEAKKYNDLLEQLEKRKGSIIVFVKTKQGAERLAQKLYNENHSANAIHGDLRQEKRERVINAFRKKRHRIMVATDVASRGLDIPHIEHVINYDLPQCPEDYIHRIGRTARAGAEGAAVSFISPADSKKWHAINVMLNPGMAKSRPPATPANSSRPAAGKKKRSFSFGANKRRGGRKVA
jgi:superfamily II DNA/RNA helicase